MIFKEEFYYPSRDGKTTIHAMKWVPDKGEIFGILQIAHGMVENIERYDEFATYLAGKGFIVVGNDHLGHGDSVVDKKNWGYFCEVDGSTVLVRDMHRLKKMTQKEYPELPIFILGHSMGSFLLRKYMVMYGSGIQGAIIMGTGNVLDIVVGFGKILTKVIAFFRGWHYRSKLVDKITLGWNDNRFNMEDDPTRSWLTRDKDKMKERDKDPKCKFIFTLNGFYNLFDTIQYVNKSSNLKKIPQSLPVLFMSGEADPMSKEGRAVKGLYELYEQLEIKDIMCKLYKDNRHELLNELERKKIFFDIESWLRVRIELARRAKNHI